MHKYTEVNQARHAARKTYLEKTADALMEKQMAKQDAAGISEEQKTSSDDVEGDKTEGAIKRDGGKKSKKQKVDRVQK